jgi:hypothetical protein
MVQYNQILYKNKILKEWLLMNKKTITWNVKQALSMMEKGTLKFDHPCQRPAGQWNEERESLLIDSILRMFVPPIYAIQEKNENDSKIYSVIDGKQRLNAIQRFLKDQFALSNLKNITLESGGNFEITGKKFSELDPAVQEEIKGTSLSFCIIEIEENDDEDQIVEEIFFRLNNGSAVSKQHLTLISTPENIQEFVNKMMFHDLFTKVAKFSDSQRKNSDIQMSILQTVLILSGKEFNSLSAKDIQEFYQNNQIDNQLLIKISDYFDQLAGIFNGEQNKFIQKIHIHGLCYLLSKNQDQFEKVKEFILWYSVNSKAGDRYRSYCGAGNIKKDKTANRLEGIEKEFQSWLKKEGK